MNNLREQKKGFTLIEIIIAVAILAVLMTIAVPNFIGMRARVRRDACINNLRQINLAKEQWALENNKDAGDSLGDTNEEAAAALDPYLKEDIWDEGEEEYTTGHSLICPLDASPTPTFGTSYTINNVGTDPVCEISGDHSL